MPGVCVQNMSQVSIRTIQGISIENTPGFGIENMSGVSVKNMSEVSVEKTPCPCKRIIILGLCNWVGCATEQVLS